MEMISLIGGFFEDCVVGKKDCISGYDESWWIFFG